MANQVYRGLKGVSYPLGRKIGEGGEGIIYEVQGNFQLVVKVYKEVVDRAKEEKLIYMAGIASPELLKFAAWPTDVVWDTSGNVAGFVMRKLSSFVPLHMLFSPMDRKKVFPDKGYNFLVHVARNLATAFHQIHQLGVIAGDVNEANILVSNTGMVALIDCDSFQVQQGSRYYFCEVGIPRYTPPELLERGSFEQVVRTVNTDSFSLATLIFQLLFLGRAPFTGVNLSKDDLEEDKAIRLGEFAYSLNRTNKKLTPAKYSLDLKSFSPGVINAFHQAFENRIARPEPKQWVIALEELNRELLPCNRSGLHFYPKNMVNCPWCAFKDAGIIYFFDNSHLRVLPELHDIEHFVNGFKIEKIEIKKLSENFRPAALRANPVPLHIVRASYSNIAIAVGSLLLAIMLSVVLSVFAFVAWVLFIVLFNRFAPSQKTIKAELNKRQVTYNTLRSSFTALVNKHNDPPELKRYNQSAAKLSSVITKFRRLPEDLISRKRKIEERYYDIKFQVYLEQFDIEHNAIPAFGPAKKTLIYKNGIRTAADILKLNSKKIAGIGPKNIHILFDWRRRIGSGFVYTPDTAAIDKDITFAANEVYVEKLQLQNTIRQEYKALMLLRDAVTTSTKRLEMQYSKLGNQMYQAELDLQAIKKRTFNNWF